VGSVPLSSRAEERPQNGKCPSTSGIRRGLLVGEYELIGAKVLHADTFDRFRVRGDADVGNWGFVALFMVSYLADQWANTRSVSESSNLWRVHSPNWHNRGIAGECDGRSYPSIPLHCLMGAQATQ
jgi:hypothetical protein